MTNEENLTLEILLDLGENPSHAIHLNYVARHGKLYVIDNHLAAFWTFHQLDLHKSYNLLHVDRHYDLIPCTNVDAHIKAINWKIEPINAITSHTGNTENHHFQFIRWDNYIHLFNILNPSVIEFGLFVTQKQGELVWQAGRYKELEIYQLFKEDLSSDRWIFNIDVDYFFTRIGDHLYQMYHDSFIRGFGEWLNEESNNADQIIICLSPEACGNWTESKRVANLILESFYISV